MLLLPLLLEELVLRGLIVGVGISIMIDVSVLNCSVARRTIVVASVIASVVAREDTKVPSVGVITITIEIGAENVGVVSALKIGVAIGIVVVTIEIVIVAVEVVAVTIIEIAVVGIVVVAIVLLLLLLLLRLEKAIAIL